MAIKIMNKFLAALILSMSVVSFSYAQDPQFSQYYANPLYLNPAFAGTARCPRFGLNYRNQWPGLSGQYVTYSASYDQHVDAVSGGIGLLVTRDVAGIGKLSTNTISGIYSYQVNVNRNFSIKAGLQASYFLKTIDFSGLTFTDMIDTRRGFIYETQEDLINQSDNLNMVDFSAGVLGFSEKFFFGFAAHHLTQPDESFLGTQAKLPRKYTAHAGAVLPFKDKDASISPNILFHMQQDFYQLNLGLYARKGPIIGGLWHRWGDALIMLIGIQQGSYKFGYSYDITVSELTNRTGGAHEFSFSYQIDCTPKKKKFRTINCPSF